MIRALLALLLVAPVAAAQVVPPDAKRLTDVACVLSGCATSGSGDIESVTITGTAPVTVTGSPCASGACVLAVSLTGMTIGTNLQAWDADLDGLAGLGVGIPWRTTTWATTVPTDNTVPYYTAAGGLLSTELNRVAQDSYRQVRGTNAQTSEVCGSYTDSSNYGCVRTSFASGEAFLLLQNPGTGGGITTSLTVGTNNTAPLLLRSHGTNRMRLNATGLAFEASDTYVINGVMLMQISRGLLSGKSKALTESTATTFVRYTVPVGAAGGGELIYVVRANDATDGQSISGRVKFAGWNKSGTITTSVADVQSTCACSAGTLTAAVTVVDAGTNFMEIKIDATSSLTQTTLAVDGRVDIPITTVPTIAYP